MSEALFRKVTGGRHLGLSAGTEPASRVHPEVVEVMREVDIDLSERTPRRLTDEIAEEADVIVTMGCGDACPYIPNKRYIDWELPDPAGQSLEHVREIRDDIGRRVRTLARELDSLESEPGAVV